MIWRPDTCLCVIELKDFATPIKIISTCGPHANLPDVASVFNQVYNIDQLSRQKIALYVKENFPQTISQTTDKDEYLSGFDLSGKCLFDDKQVLNVQVDGLTNSDAKVVQSWADDQFGPGKVIVS